MITKEQMEREGQDYAEKQVFGDLSSNGVKECVTDFVAGMSRAIEILAEQASEGFGDWEESKIQENGGIDFPDFIEPEDMWQEVRTPLLARIAELEKTVMAQEKERQRSERTWKEHLDQISALQECVRDLADMLHERCQEGAVGHVGYMRNHPLRKHAELIEQARNAAQRRTT